jgi:cysteine desulfurase
MNGNNVIYLDNNATTPLDPRVLDAMLPYFTENFGNASSQHPFGEVANAGVKEARNQVANLIGADMNELIFTSGATEGINLAIKGVFDAYVNKGSHIITVCTEHTAVLDVCRYLETIGAEVTYLPVQSDGLLNLDTLKDAIRPDTILVSVMFVNNETGVIQPIKEIAEIAHEKSALFMTDATQAVGKLPLKVDEYGIDIMPFSGHKLYGPKGVGALFIRQRRPNKVRIIPLQHGGGHERGYRSGTLNVPGIVGLGKACQIAQKEMNSNEKKILKWRDELELELLKIDGAFINGHKEKRLYNTINICFPDIDSDALIMGLTNPENNSPSIMVSNGSACTATSIEPSHVLMGMD